MNPIAVSAGGYTVYWSSIVIVLGVLAGFLLSLSLCRGGKCRVSAIICFYPLAVFFSVIFCRVIHWYISMDNYASFRAALTNYAVGGYCIAGIIPAALLAGGIARALGLVGRVGALFDAVMPGALMSVAFVRLADIFGTACRSKITINTPLLCRLPFAFPMTDTVGNVIYRFATFFISFLLLLVLSIVIVRLYRQRRDARMLPGVSGAGNIACLGLAFAGAIEIVLDSTRSDPVSMHFVFLTKLNKYVGFISVTMLTCAICILCVFIRYFKGAKRKSKVKASLLLVLYIVSLIGVAAAEYLVQRFTGMFILFRSIQTLSAVLMALSVWFAYKLCCVDNNA